MDEKLKNVIRLVSELQKAIDECPDVLMAYLKNRNYEDMPQLQLYKGNDVEFANKRNHENGTLEKFAIINGVRVIKLCLDGDEK